MSLEFLKICREVIGSIQIRRMFNHVPVCVSKQLEELAVRAKSRISLPSPLDDAGHSFGKHLRRNFAEEPRVLFPTAAAASIIRLAALT